MEAYEAYGGPRRVRVGDRALLSKAGEFDQAACVVVAVAPEWLDLRIGGSVRWVTAEALGSGEVSLQFDGLTAQAAVALEDKLRRTAVRSSRRSRAAKREAGVAHLHKAEVAMLRDRLETESARLRRAAQVWKVRKEELERAYENVQQLDKPQSLPG